MKAEDDKKRSFREFSVGDKVFLKLQPYAQTSVVNRPNHKLAMKFFGPFEVQEKFGPSAYKLLLPAGSLVNPVFHTSQLKPHVPDHTPVFNTLPELPLLDRTELVPEEFLDRCLVKKGNASLAQVLIRWTDLPASSATWEDYDTVRQRFPVTPAWGQAASSGRGTVSAGKLPGD